VDSTDATGWFALLDRHPDLEAAVIGLLLSWCATQFFKKMLPDTWSEALYRRVTQTIGFITGWVFTHGAWHLLDPTASRFEHIYYSAGIGFASPAMYSLVVGWATNKWPGLESRMSGRPRPAKVDITVNTDLRSGPQ
jgi:hypothetical protein